MSISDEEKKKLDSIMEEDKKNRERDGKIDDTCPPNYEHLAMLAAMVHKTGGTVQASVEFALGIIDHSRKVVRAREIAFEKMRDKERGL